MIEQNNNTEASRIVFLDVDGVLNSYLWTVRPKTIEESQGDPDLDPFAINLLNEFTQIFDLKIVISSDWRISSYCIPRLKNAGVRNIIDTTPVTIFQTRNNKIHFTRGEEIQLWLDAHPEVENFVIFDDREDFEQLNHYVKVDSYRGLTQEDIQKAVEILSKINLEN